MYIIYNSAPAADTQGFCFWWGRYPLSHGLRRASSPKGTPLGYAGDFTATTKAVPLGKVASPQAMTEGVIPPRKEIGKKMSKSVDNCPGVWYYT